MIPRARATTPRHSLEEPESWKRQWRDILVYLECRDGVIHPASLQVLGKARELAGACGCDVQAIAIGGDGDRLRALATSLPLKRAYVFVTAGGRVAAEAYSVPFVRCVERLRPAVVLLAATAEGKAIAPRLAAAFGSGLTAECTGLEMAGESDLIQTRPAYGGDVMARIVTSRSRPQFATVRPDAMPAWEETVWPGPAVEVIVEEAGLSLGRWATVLAARPRPPLHDIARAAILVVAGRGLRRREDLVLLRRLSALLGGELAATRGIVELGWMPADRQIGLSGRSVDPELLIACGVSGSVQFLAGVRRAGPIVAINPDREARIFDVAHYPILGDLYEIVPELIARLDAPGGR